MNKPVVEPLIPATIKLPELTVRAIIIAIILAVVLAASNAYLALKIGMTISASIPASVMALGILRFFKNSNVLESNIIQTAASAGEGVAAAVSFILPAMIVLHVWKGFSYWETTLVSMLGGVLGVLFSIPLRRVMLDLPQLRFPEGTAIGNVLITSTKKGSFMQYLVYGGSAGAFVSLSQSGFKFLSDTVQAWTFWGNSLLGMSFGLTPATIAAGYIIGIEVGITMLVGLLIGWVLCLPLIGITLGVGSHVSAFTAAMDIWSKHLRFIGVGTMLIGGIYTLLRLLRPVIEGLKLSFATLGKGAGDLSGSRILRTDKDIAIHWVIASVLVIAVCLYVLFIRTLLDFHLLQVSMVYLLFVTFITLIYVLLIGFILAAICGYFTGLIGSSNNPLSGILIIALILLSLLYLGLFDVNKAPLQVAAVVILIATVVATVASISNENLQDLKAGQMVGATPWKQQVMLGVGVVVSTFIIGPVLDLLFKAYGMAGVFPRAGMDKSQMLAAPQASLMAAVVNGVLLHKLDWDMIFIGFVVAIVIIFVDEFLRRKYNHRLPALAVGLGIYLPPEITTPIILGTFINYLVRRSGKNKVKIEADKEWQHDLHQRGVLLACGMVAGSALMGVILAILFVMLGSSGAINLVSRGFKPVADILGVIVTLALCYWFYHIAHYRLKQ